MFRWCTTYRKRSSESEVALVSPFRPMELSERARRYSLQMHARTGADISAAMANIFGSVSLSMISVTERAGCQE
jgi:hypothetical protein